MCTLTLQTEPLIAKGAITVYKIFNRKDYEHDKSLITPYMHHRWELNKVEKAELRETGDSSSFDGIDLDFILKQKNKLKNHIRIRYIAKGLHASTRVERITRSLYCDKKHILLVKGYIPKNSLYYTTGDGLIVANKMVMKKVITM